jgi:hypothetical protein
MPYGGKPALPISLPLEKLVKNSNERSFIRARNTTSNQIPSTSYTADTKNMTFVGKSPRQYNRESSYDYRILTPR